MITLNVSVPYQQLQKSSCASSGFTTCVNLAYFVINSFCRLTIKQQLEFSLMEFRNGYSVIMCSISSWISFDRICFSGQPILPPILAHEEKKNRGFRFSKKYLSLNEYISFILLIIQSSYSYNWHSSTLGNLEL